jgi:hypothetical protein
MKENILFIFLACITQTGFSQDCFAELRKMTLANDSLNKVIKIQKSNSEQNLNTLNDSIAHLHTTHNIELSKLRNQIGKLEKDTTHANKQIKKLDKNNIKKLDEQLVQKTDSISMLKTMLADTIRNNNTKITLIKNTCENNLAINYSKGQQEAYNKIAKEYESSTLDALILSSTRLSIERDLLIVGTNATAKQRLQDLKNYFEAKSILEDKFDMQKVQIALSQLNSIKNESHSAKSLIESINDYKLCNDALRKTVGKILDIDTNYVANDDNTQNLKFQKIVFELAVYLREYSFNFNFIEYPYLSAIVLEVINRKKRDSNTDIKDLLLKL